MSTTDWRIIIAAAWLWVIKWFIRKDSNYAGTGKIYIKRNGSTILEWWVWGLYEDFETKLNWDAPETSLNTTILCDQWDYFQIEIDNQHTSSARYPAGFNTLRVISYVLY